MITVYNLANDTQVTFSETTTPERAVAYCYHEEMRQLSKFFASTSSNDGWWESNTPIQYGKNSVCAGNWACINDVL